MLKKILMISDNDITSDTSLGVTKKLLGQYKAFRNLGFDTYHLCFKDEQGVLIHNNETKVLVKKHKKLYFTYMKLLGMAHNVCLENNIDLCYIRYPLADFPFMSMIKKLHKICKVVVEIPTFPYDNENTGTVSVITKLIFSQDLRNRYKLKNYVDLIANYHGCNEIFGVRSICIDNGINCSAVKYTGDLVQYGPDVTTIGVALMINIHGYDRLIEGLKNYYSAPTHNRRVYFYAVGDGPEARRLKDMVKEYGLADYVFFTGIKSGKELDDLFEKSHIAVASLAAHRRKGKATSELKVKEYCARGIPYIATSKDNAIPDDQGFNCFFPANDDPINIEKIIEFYDCIKSHPEIPWQMRKFAEETMTWEKQLKKVIDAV